MIFKGTVYRRSSSDPPSQPEVAGEREVFKCNPQRVCQRPIPGHGSFRISSQVQAASNRLLFDCHRWPYDTQFCETAKQDGFGRGFGPETGPLENVSSNARFLRRHGDAAGGTRSVD